jgi:hypothetical protein
LSAEGRKVHSLQGMKPKRFCRASPNKYLRGGHRGNGG